MEKFLTNFYAQTISVALRAALIGGGAAIVTATQGTVTPSMIETGTGAIMVLAALIWSLGEKIILAQVVKRIGFSF